MARPLPKPVSEFLTGRRFAVAGVSRDPSQPANAIYRRLLASGYETIPVNPHSSEVEGVASFPDLASIPGELDGVVVVTPPEASVAVVRQCAQHGVPRVWLHRSFGCGSVSREAVREADSQGVRCIVGGCPLMFCEPVDFGHRCMRWWLQRRGRVPR